MSTLSDALRALEALHPANARFCGMEEIRRAILVLALEHGGRISTLERWSSAQTVTDDPAATLAPRPPQGTCETHAGPHAQGRACEFWQPQPALQEALSAMPVECFTEHGLREQITLARQEVAALQERMQVQSSRGRDELERFKNYALAATSEVPEEQLGREAAELRRRFKASARGMGWADSVEATALRERAEKAEQLCKDFNEQCERQGQTLLRFQEQAAQVRKLLGIDEDADLLEEVEQRGGRAKVADEMADMLRAEQAPHERLRDTLARILRVYAAAQPLLAEAKR